LLKQNSELIEHINAAIYVSLEYSYLLQAIKKVLQSKRSGIVELVTHLLAVLEVPVQIS
jgi:hypothetical protein